MEMNEKNKNYLKYLNLSPTSNASDIEEYSEVLNYCLKNDDILNIAISGPYGSGKSSFLKTYFSKNHKYETITITLGDYVDRKEKNNDNDNDNEYYQSIEKSILQQLLYQVSNKKVPQSKFKRIEKYSKFFLFVQSLFFILILSVLLTIFFPGIITFFSNNFTFITRCLLFIPNFKLFNLKINSGIILTCIFYILAYLFLAFLLYKISEMFKNNISISRLKFKNTEIEINNKSESIFNKYLDEIIYFFQSTKYKAVIIEDLDRFQEATFIFQKLKELNQLINSSKKIKRKIKFIYAIKDDFFTNSKDRTKFFDKIIPIISISSYTNSNEIIWEKLEKIYGKNTTYGDIDKKFIDDISIFLDDMRIINNVISEFIIYHDMFIKKNLDDKKLFFMIMYKNLYPNEYSNLLIGKGVIPETFKNINKNVKEIIIDINNDIDILNENITSTLNEHLKCISELKFILICNLVHFDKTYNDHYFLFNSDKVKITDFLKDQFDLSKIKNEKVTFVYDFYPSKKLTEDETFSYFNGKDSFISRLEIINNKKERKLEELQNNIAKNTDKVKNIKEKELKELINSYGIDKFVQNGNELEKFALSRGYITSDYNDYISIFKEGNLTYNDMKFIKAVKKGEQLEYSYHLEHVEEIITRLNPIDFSNICILNNDLLDYIISVNEKYSHELEKIISLFTDISDKNFGFIEQYEFSEKFLYFSSQLVCKSKNLWSYIYINKIGDIDTINKWIIIFISNPDSINNTDEKFISFINDHENFCSIAPKSKLLSCFDCLKEINIKFSKLNFNNDKELFTKILQNDMYELNIHMITEILKLFGIAFDEISDKLLTLIYKNKELEPMKSYITNNFERFINGCYIHINDYNDDEYVLIEILNSSYINIDCKEIIIGKENIYFKNINLINKDIYDLLIKYNRIDPNLNNVLVLYETKGNLTKDIINLINTDKINFCELQTIDNIILKNHFEYDISTSNDILFNIYEKIIQNIDIIQKLENKTINKERIKMLVENRKIEFTKDNFNNIKNNYENFIYTFINNNKEKFKEIHEEIDINYKDLFISNEIDSSLKQYLLDNNYVDLMSIEETELYNLLIKNIIVINDENVNIKILNSQIDVEKKINYLFKFREKIDINKLLDLIHLLGTDYSYIGSKWKSANIKYNEQMIDILELLKSNRLISSYKKGRNANIVIYNKRNN